MNVVVWLLVAILAVNVVTAWGVWLVVRDREQYMAVLPEVKHLLEYVSDYARITVGQAAETKKDVERIGTAAVREVQTVSALAQEKLTGSVPRE